MARLLLALALVASIWSFVGGDGAHACIRPVLVSQEQLIRVSASTMNLIFIGEVIVAEEPDRDHRVRTFAVERYLKGDGPRLLTTISKPVCRDSLGVGGTYLYGVIGGHIFLGRPPSAKAEEHVSQMETALLAEYGTLGSFSDDPLPPWATAAGFGATLALAGGLLLGVRRLGIS